MLTEKIEEIKEALDLTTRDAEKAAAGNKAAGVRLRKDIKKAIDALNAVRKEVLVLREGE